MESGDGKPNHLFFIKHCYNKGTITNSGRYTGGILGRTASYEGGDSAEFVNCYNLGNVTSTYNSTSYVTGVGGIIGIEQSIGSTSYTKRNVKRCYNSGNIQSTYSTTESAGGIIGITTLSVDKITDCYVKRGTTIKGVNGSRNYDVGSSYGYGCYLVGYKQAGTVTINGNTCSTSTTYGVLDDMPTVFAVVSGSEGNLNTGTSSDIWEYDTANLNSPKLKWEITNN